MDSRTAFSLLYLFSVFMSSVSQVLLKKSAQSPHDGALREYLNWRVITAYGIFFCSTLVTVLALRYVPLSQSGIFESTGYIYIAVLSVVFLKEKLSLRKILGMILILAGVVMFSL